MVLTLRGKSSERVSDFLSHIEEKFPDLHSTCRWVAAA
jgi:hypothetical protein